MTIKKLIFLRLVSFIFFIWSGLFYAQTNTEYNKTILFKISSVDSPNVSYLFGTHHAFGSEFFEGLSPAKEALFSSDLLVKENRSDVTPTASEIINSRADTTRWKQFLNKKSIENVEKLFAASPSDYHKMSPAELFVFLNRYYSQEICLKIDGSNGGTLDNYIQELAENKKMKVVGLESTLDQIKLINKDVEGMPRRVHQKRLNSMIKLIQSKSTANCNLVDWYQSMEIDYKISQECGNTLVLTSRNNKWSELLIPKLKSTNCFIAVGLSHLMYECGLLNQLKEAGFNITAVQLN